MAVHIKNILAKIIEKDDWRIDLMRRWDMVVGSLQTKVRLEKTYDDTAVIGVYESHWLQELYLLSDELCDSINNVIGQHKIKNIRFVLVEERERPKQVVQKPKKLVVPATVTLTDKQQKALKGIKDPELKDAMKVFWSRCMARFEEGEVS